MTESVAGLIAESVATSNRYGGSGDPDPIAQEFRYREQLRLTLTKSGTTKARIEELLAPFATWIPFDLRNAILQSVFDLQREKGATSQESNALQSSLEAALRTTPPLDGLQRAREIIQEKGLSSPSLNENIRRYESFLTTDHLPDVQGGTKP